MAHKNRKHRESFADKVRDTLKVCSTIVLIMGCVYFGVLILADKHVKKVNSNLQDQFSTAQSTITDTPVSTATETPQQLASAATAAPTDAVTQAPTDVPQATATAVPAQQGANNLAPVVTQPTEPVLQPQFEQLYAQNNDLIGWIKAGKDIDLPVLYRDNEFYMDHDFYGAYSSAGSIFLDERNNPNMSDDHMLIYGHNMKNGSMFGTLKAYRDVAYLRQYPIISLQYAWESEPRKYVLVSLFDASMTPSDPSYIKITEFNFDTPDEKQSFIDAMLAKSTYDIPLDVDADDQLITLVTCSYTHDDGRYLLTARLLREDETEEQIMQLFEQVQQ